jgi:hypothetical protein
MNERYYWAGFYKLEPGSIVKAGNWGRVLSITRFNSNPFIILREQILENIRIMYYPQRPSRMRSIFVCPTIDSLKEFKNQCGKHADLIHEVELVDSNLPKFESDWNFYGMSENNNLIQSYELAHQYWIGNKPNHREILSLSDIRIIQCID